MNTRTDETLLAERKAALRAVVGRDTKTALSHIYNALYSQNPLEILEARHYLRERLEATGVRMFPKAMDRRQVKRELES